MWVERERERAEEEAEVHVCFFHSAPGQTLVKPGEEKRQDRKLQSLKCPEYYFVCFCLFTSSHNFIFPTFVFLRLNIFLPFLFF